MAVSVCGTEWKSSSSENVPGTGWNGSFSESLTGTGWKGSSRESVCLAQGGRAVPVRLFVWLRVEGQYQ